MDSVEFRGANATDSIASLKSSPCRKLCKFGSYGVAMEESKINQLTNSPNHYVCPVFYISTLFVITAFVKYIFTVMYPIFTKKDKLIFFFKVGNDSTNVKPAISTQVELPGRKILLKNKNAFR